MRDIVAISPCDQNLLLPDHQVVVVLEAQTCGKEELVLIKTYSLWIGAKLYGISDDVLFFRRYLVGNLGFASFGIGHAFYFFVLCVCPSDGTMICMKR
jgi:hypothetical protein